MNKSSAHSIAIIGMAGRFPGANNVNQFWDNLRDGVESISYFSDEELLASGRSERELSDPSLVRAGAVLEGAETFDASFFEFNPREAEILDPQHRIFMECAHTALEDAGYDYEKFRGRIGVFGGTGANSYFRHNILTNKNFDVGMFGGEMLLYSTDKDFLCSRASYKLNLKGPSLNVQTACSTSLVAVHLACQSLFCQECDMALAGGVTVSARQKSGYFYRDGSIASPDGHCRAFDAEARGTVFGSGAGIVVLKRLEDALADGDFIRAVIIGSAINNDGSLKIGYTAPSVEGQAEVIAEAQAVAGVEPDSITYIEAHGTGTQLGDPIEVAALTEAFRFRSDRKQFCAIGSVKTNVGHLDTAAGVTGLIKTALALQHKMIPPSLNFDNPNPAIDFENSPFYVNTKLSEWKTNGTARHAGVSSFGIGGTNAHLIVKEAPIKQLSGPSRPWRLIVLSAKTSSALEAASANLARHLKSHPELDLADVAYTLQVGRRAFEHRRAVVCSSLEDAGQSLESLDPGHVSTARVKARDRAVVFMFPGQGSQYVNMGLDLYRNEPAFKEHLDFCSDALKPLLGADLRDLLYPDEAQVEEASRRLAQTSVTQPALFAIEYSLAKWWMGLGLKPKALIGHSIGEYVAACLSGVFSLSDALTLVAMRGQLMQEAPGGAMLSVAIPESRIRHFLDSRLALAAVNSDSRCVVAGPGDAIEELENKLRANTIECRRVITSHAFHSQMMDPIVKPFSELVGKIKLRAPQIPYISNVTGSWITAPEATDAGYWGAHLRRTVMFADGARALIKASDAALLEVGPGRTLSALIAQQAGATSGRISLTTLRSASERQSDEEHLARTVGKLWQAGVELDWEQFHLGQNRQRLALPTYPFERKRYWIEVPPKNSDLIVQYDQDGVSSTLQQGGNTLVAARPSDPRLPQRAATQSQPARREKLLSQLKIAFKDLTGIDTEELDIHATFFELGADSLLLVQVSQLLENRFRAKIPFRWLFEKITTLDLLAAHLESELPEEYFTPDTDPSQSRSVVAVVERGDAPPAPHAQGQVCALRIPASEQAEPRAEEIKLQSFPPAPFAIPQAPASAIEHNGSSADGDTIERILSQQLHVMSRIMSEQLGALRGSAANGGNHKSSAAAALIPAPAQPVSQPGQATTDNQAERFIPHKPLDVNSKMGLTARQQEYLDSFIEGYTKRTAKSKSLAESARAHLADARLSTGFRLILKEIVYPLYSERTTGSKVWDVDGNEYVDLAMGYGTHLFGNSPQFVVEAMEEQIRHGLGLTPQREITGKVADLICELTGAERANFCNSGTEAIGGAIRIARAVTRRKKIAIFAGSFHGWSDATMARKYGALQTGPSAPGVLPETVGETIVLDYGSPESLEAIKAHARELAAVLVEPVQSRRPDFFPREFLRELRKLTTDSGIALIFDEMVTGFRLHPNGAQAWSGVKADISLYGKVAGGGMPIGVIAGKAAFLDAFDGGWWKFGDSSYPESEHTFYAGTFFKHPLSMAAAYATLSRLKLEGPALQENLNRRTTQMIGRIKTYFEQNAISIRAVNCGSLFRFFPPRDLILPELFFYHLTMNGVFNWEGGNFFLSTSHTEEDVDRAVEAIFTSVEQLKDGGFLPGRASSPERKRSARDSDSGPASENTAKAESSDQAAFARAPASRPIPAATIVSEDKTEAASHRKAVADLLGETRSRSEEMRFSLYFFGNYPEGSRDNKYELLFRSVRFADQHGFSSVWLPERHFSPIGGVSPNPSVLAAAVSRETERLRICAGSVVIPLHNPIRIAEEWSVIDNISNGRVAISFASGWHQNDFVFAPDSYANRREIMLKGIETVRHLWRGGSVRAPEGSGKEIEVKIFPKPLQADLPFWLTGGSPQTLEDAGRMGAGFLTNLVDHDVNELAEKIAAYRRALARAGFDPKSGHVTLLVHTFVSDDLERARRKAGGPFHEYLKAYFKLVSNKIKSRGSTIDVAQISDEDFQYILAGTHERFLRELTLIGSPESCLPFVNRLSEIGVDEISCLIDFGVDTETVMEGLHYLDALKEKFREARSSDSTRRPQGAEMIHAQTEAARLPGDEREAKTDGVIPVTGVQKQVWILAQMGDAVSKGLHVSITLHLRGRLNLAAMRRAIQKLFDRHEALRATAEPDGESQLIHPTVTVDVPVKDFSYLGGDERKRDVKSWIRKEAQLQFKLDRGPLARFSIARMEDEHHLLVFTAHHFIIDGRSGGIIISEIASLYSAECKGVDAALPEPASFTGYVREVVAHQQGPEAARDEEYWQRIFPDYPPILELPLDRPRPQTPTYNGARRVVRFNSALAAGLEKLSSKQGCSQFMISLAGFKVLLNQLTGQDDLVVGINVAQRLTANSRSLIAFTVNPLAIRSKIFPEIGFSDYLETVKERVFGAYEHQNLTVTTLNKKAGMRRDPKKWNIVPVAFNFERSGQGPKFDGLQVEAETNALDSGRLDLYIDITEKNGDLTLVCDYNSDLLEEATILSWLLHYEALLEAIVKDPEQAIAALPRFHRAKERTVPQFDGAVELGLTKYQLLIWAGQKLHPAAPMYVNAGYGIIPAAIDREHYLKAIRALIRNCDALRAIVVDEDGAPRQRILPDFSYEPEYLDFSQEADPRGKLDDWARRRCQAPLNMNERMFDLALIKLADTEYAMYANTHHLITDAWSVTLMSALMGEYYQLSLNGRLDEAEKPPQFQDFVKQEFVSGESPRALKAQEYWKEKLAEEIEPLKFYSKTTVRRTTRAERLSCDLGVERTRKLKAIARRADVFIMSDDASLQHVFTAIVATYLYHISGNRRISIGVPFHNRKSGQKTIGLLMQILPLRMSVEEGDSFLSLIGKIGGEYFKILRYHEHQIGNPLQRQAYDVEFNFINAKNPRLFDGVPVKHHWLHPGHAADNLAIQIYDNLSGGLTCEFDFHCDVFDEDERPLAINHFLRVVDALCENAERMVDSVSLVSGDERDRILVEFNRTETPFPQDQTFAQLFQRQAHRAPDNLAASDESRTLTYAELNRRSNRLAHHLTDLGIGPEALVALFSRRSVDFLTAMLAVFKAGAGYMPLDPEYPPERVARILTQSQCRLVLATEEFWPEISRALEQTPLDEQPLVLQLEDLLWRAGAEDDPPPRSWPASLSYVIYTSGSTGSPKGAMVEQAGMINHLYIKVRDLSLTDSDVVAQSASHCSDVSVWQFLSALLTGGRVHILNDHLAKDPMSQLSMVDREGITILEIVPSQLRAMVEGMAIIGDVRPDLASLKRLIVNGEALTPDICRRWREFYPDTPLMNAYGPTECSDDVTHYLLRQLPALNKTRVPIGRPLANLRLYVLDKKLSLAPIGVAGEIYIGGTGVGRGYLKDPERTAQSFLPDSFTDEKGARIYKTGDLGRYLPDGNLEFINRVDHQVKIRGFRVELGEVESALCNHPAVAQAVAMVREDTPGDKRLVAYILASSGQKPSATELRGFLREKLPDYMTPSTFVLLDSLTLLPNGKVNQKALPAPDSSRPELECEFVAPQSEIEQTLANIWAEVLGLERVGAHDNFFDLGGDSIMIILIAAKANQAGLRLMPMQIFERQTIAELAEVVGSAAAINAEQGEVAGPAPLTPVQRWFFEQDIADVHYYNQALMLELRKPVDSSLMEKAVERLIFHHDALRLRFKNNGGEWNQFHDPTKGAASYAKVDLSAFDDQDQRRAIEAKAAELQAILNLFEGPVFRVALFDLGSGKANRLFIAAHHLVIDGVSWRILLTDLQIAYEQLERDAEIKLPPKTTSFKQWGERLAEYSQSAELRQEADYWLGIISEPVGRLPLDLDSVENTRESADVVTVSLDEEETKILLQDVAKTYDAQINDILLSALARVLSDWTGAQLHLIKLEGHGREQLFDDLDISRTIGWFTSMFPALLDAGENRSPLDALKSVKGQLRQIPNRGVGYGLLCYMSANAGLKEKLDPLPVLEVEFNYLGQVDQMVSEASLFKPARESSGPSTVLKGARSCLVDIGAIVINKQLQVDWVYSRNLHHRSTIERLAGRYLEELRLFIAHSLSLQDSGEQPYSDDFNWSMEDLDEIASVLDKSTTEANRA